MSDTLAAQVNQLENAYRLLHQRHGELLATLRLPRNRASVEANNIRDIRELWGVIDREWKEFHSANFPTPDAAIRGDEKRCPNPNCENGMVGAHVACCICEGRQTNVG